MKETITLKGNRDEWIDFIAIMKKNKKEVWDVLGPMLKEYIKKKQR